jgi:hypothetical protein
MSAFAGKADIDQTGGAGPKYSCSDGRRPPSLICTKIPKVWVFTRWALDQQDRSEVGMGVSVNWRCRLDMAWRRGFFRLWVVLSVLWIGLVVYLNEPKTYIRFSNPVYEVKSSDGRVRRFNLAGSQTKLAADLTEWMQAERPDINISEFENDRDELVTALKAEYQAEVDEAKTAWLFTVLPPLALLGFGLCILWIVRGFRPRTQPLN